MDDFVAEKVISVLASVKRIPRESISLGSSLEDLGLDSLDVITMLFELEKEFQISISDDEARSVHSVCDIVEGVRKLLAGASLPSRASAD